MEPSVDDVGRSPGGNRQRIRQLLEGSSVKLDQSPSLGLWYGIRYIPTILYFVDGEERVRFFGMTRKEVILSQLKLAINSRLESGFARFNKD